MLITGDPEWSDYTLEVKVRAISYAGFAGIVFRYHTTGTTICSVSPRQ